MLTRFGGQLDSSYTYALVPIAVKKRKKSKLESKFNTQHSNKFLLSFTTEPSRYYSTD